MKIKEWITIFRSYSLSFSKKLLSFLRSQYPIYAGLSLSFFFILSSYKKNIYDVPVGELFIPLILSIIFCVFFYTLYQLSIKNKHIAGLATFCTMYLLIYFERTFLLFKRTIDNVITMKSPYDYKYVLLYLAAVVLFFVVVGVLVKRLKSKSMISELSKFLSVGMTVYMATFVVQIAYIQVSDRALFVKPISAEAAVLSDDQESPDIYYFVFDRYANEESLNKYYDYSNKDFLSELQSEGFLINENEYSNYQYTAASLSSTLNADYLDAHTEDLPQKYSELLYANLIEGSSALKSLRNAGYTHYHSGSWWGTTRTNPSADFNFVDTFTLRFLNRPYVVSDFQDILVENTFLRRILAGGPPLIKDIVRYEKSNQRQIVKYQFNSVKDVVKRAEIEKTVGFFHILSPHPQYVFDSDGSVPNNHPDASYGDVPESVKYTNQLEYINTQILETIQYIKENSNTEPIIIIQSDEGPYAFVCGDDPDCPTYSSTSEKWKWKFGVLSAAYLPSTATEYDVSAVNIFPYIFNNYINANEEYLVNKNYVFDLNKNPYVFKDLTEMISETSSE